MKGVIIDRTTVVDSSEGEENLYDRNVQDEEALVRFALLS
jgi:hypothetical protein